MPTLPVGGTQAGQPGSSVQIGAEAILPGVLGPVSRSERRRLDEPTSSTARQELRCVWYQATLADALADVDEFFRTPAGTAALADFYRVRRSSPEPECDARVLVDAIGRAAAKLRA